MKISTHTLPILWAIILTGCATTKEKPRVERVIQVQQTAAQITTETPVVPFRTPEKLGVYYVGRTRDPADPKVLHLGHQVVRIERPAGWVKLSGPEGTHTLITEGPEDPLATQADTPTAADLELQTRTVKSVMEKVAERNEVLVRKLDIFTESAKDATALKEENAELKTQLQHLQARVEKVEGEEREQKAREAKAIQVKEEQSRESTSPKKFSWKFWE